MLDGLLETAPDLTASTGPPAHAQIETWLTSLIAAGSLVVGDKLPKEKDLAAELGVSRMTLRQALASLEARGVVERIPGRRGGTFITEPKIDIDITGLAGFTEQLRRGPSRAGARVVSASVVTASRAWPRRCRSPPTPRCTRSSGCGRPIASRWRWSGPTCRWRCCQGCSTMR